MEAKLAFLGHALMTCSTFPARARLNRPGFAGGSNFQIGWSHDEQNDEQIFSRGSGPRGGSRQRRRSFIIAESCLGERVGFVNDRKATAFGGGPKGRH
jgi:hypothetical protein